MPNLLLTGPGTPPSRALPPSTYGHAFLRTDAVTRLTGIPPCNLNCCTPTESFRNIIPSQSSAVSPASPPAPPGFGSCDVNGEQVPGASPSPLSVAFGDLEVPPLGKLFFYLGDVFTSVTPCPAADRPVGNNCFGPFGTSHTVSGDFPRCPIVNCP